MEGIQQMFHELMGYEEYQLEMFGWVMRRREAARLRAQDETPRAIELRRARQRAYWKRKHPPVVRAYVNPPEKRERHRLRMQARRAEARALQAA